MDIAKHTPLDECTSDCRKLGCPNCPHGKKEDEYCEPCDDIEETSRELAFWLRKTRMETGGIPITKIAEIIKEELHESEIKSLRKSL